MFKQRAKKGGNRKVNDDDDDDEEESKPAVKAAVRAPLAVEEVIPAPLNLQSCLNLNLYIHT